MQLTNMLFAVLTVFAFLLLSEWGWRKHWLRGEIGRKFVHITVGTFVAFWPYFLDWTEIRLLSLAFFVVVLGAMQLGAFKALGSVQRPTYGEVFFALSVGLLTLITSSKGVYAAAILQMALADGFAAIVGTRYGTENKYHMFGRAKSAAGSGTFFAISLGLLVGYSLFSVGGLPWQYVLIGATGATILENLAVFGFDNLLVPVAIGVLLQAVS